MVVTTVAVAASGSAVAVSLVPLGSITGGEPAIVAVLVGVFLVGLFGASLGYGRYQRGQLIEATEDVAIGEATHGRVAITGTVRPAEEALSNPLTDGENVHYSYRIRDHVEKPDDEITDSEEDIAGGDTEWETVSQSSDSVPFYVDDGTGTALVAIDEEPTYSIGDDNTTRSDDEDGDGLVGLSNDDVPPDVITRVHRETVLPVGEDVCVLGRVDGPGSDGEADLVVGRDAEAGLFAVTDGTKADLSRSLSLSGPLIVLGGLATSAVVAGLLVYDFVLA
ncbi:E3 ubiquitin ligase family protein [Halovivax cerinus]|uniref:RING-type E3 ubiquitin transferase n=1 Tax=Halovivax cerinus TaxID=1487865 RepID=A0ABD5NR29_9EURY|nr:E3 ubiquitin ligase family protein [Halovivax cerinus]